MRTVQEAFTNLSTRVNALETHKSRIDALEAAAASLIPTEAEKQRFAAMIRSVDAVDLTETYKRYVLDVLSGGVGDCFFASPVVDGVIFIAAHGGAGTPGCLIAFDTTTDTLKWARVGVAMNWNDNATSLWTFGSSPYVAVTGPVGTQGPGHLRNTPFVCKKGYVWVTCNVKEQACIAGFRAADGKRVLEHDVSSRLSKEPMNKFDPDRVNAFGFKWSEFNAGMLRTGVHVRYDENDTPIAIYGLTFSDEYSFINYSARDDMTPPGVFAGVGRVECVNLLTGDELWSVKSCPEEILPEGQLLSTLGVFRNGETEVSVAVPLFDGSGALIADEIPPSASIRIDSDQKFVVAAEVLDASGKVAIPAVIKDFVLPAGELFSKDAMYVADDGSEYSGQHLIDVLGANGPQLVNAHVGGNYQLTRHEDGSGRLLLSAPETYVAYQLNYYGGGVWADCFCVVDDKTVSVSVGNGTAAPLDTSRYQAAKGDDLRSLDVSYTAGLIPIDTFKQQYLNHLQSRYLSPRDRRAFIDSVVTLDVKTGEVLSLFKGETVDSWTAAELGGFGAIFGGEANFGQPGGKPYLEWFGTDGDFGCTPVHVNGRIGSVSKSGVYFVQDLPTAVDGSGKLLTTCVHFGDDTSLDFSKGISSMALPTTQMGAAGLVGVIGGANYALTHDGERLLVNITNSTQFWFFGDAEEAATESDDNRPPWVTHDGVSIPTGTSYITAIDMAEGKIVWNAPLHPGSAVYAAHTGVVQDGLLWHAPRGPRRHASGEWKFIVYGIDTKTGEIVREIEIDGATARSQGGRAPMPIGDFVYHYAQTGGWNGPPHGGLNAMYKLPKVEAQAEDADDSLYFYTYAGQAATTGALQAAQQ